MELASMNEDSNKRELKSMNENNLIKAIKKKNLQTYKKGVAKWENGSFYLLTRKKKLLK